METHLASNASPHKAACGTKAGKLHVGQLRIARPGETVTCAKCVEKAAARALARGLDKALTDLATGR